jgi:hypothetical protein
MNVINNMCVNANSGIGSNVAYHWWSPSSGVPAWTGVNFYNNTAYNVGQPNGDACISIDSGNPSNSAIVENNVLSTCGGPGLAAASGVVKLHDYNDYYSTASCLSETHGFCTDPMFVSTAKPYVDTNFSLQAATPLKSSGVDLSSIFTTDYFEATRTTPWDMSATAMGSTPGPAPPTALQASVN